MKSKGLIFGAAILGFLALIVFVVFLQTPASEEADLDTATPEAVQESQSEETEIPTPSRDDSEPARTRAETPTLAAGGEEDGEAIGKGILKGRIVEQEGTPVPNFKVEAYKAQPELFLPDMSDWFDEEKKSFAPEFLADGTTTDEEGRFELTGLPSRAFYALGLDIQGNRPQVRIIDHIPAPGETVDLGDIHLDAYVTFMGRVIDESGKPVPGARVRATNLPAIIFQVGVQDVQPDGALLVLEEIGDDDFRALTAPPWLKNLLEKAPIPKTMTDAEGKFRLEGVPLGLATVVVDKKELPVLVHGPTATGQSGERDLGDLRMQEGEEIEGKVVNSDGDPVPGAKVYAGSKSTMAPVAILKAVGETDGKGKFLARGIKDGAAYAVARMDASSPWGVSEEITPGFDSPTIILETGQTVTVSVTDEEGTTIPQAQIALKSSITEGEFPLLFPPVSTAGRMKRTEKGGFQIEKLNPGGYFILARAPGFALQTKEFKIKKGEPTEVNIPLPKAIGATVQVVNETTNEPLRGARVSVRNDNTRDWSVSLMSAITDAEGKADVTGLAPGNYILVASHGQYATTTQKAALPQELLTMALPSGGTLEGTILENGGPVQIPRMLILEPRGKRDFIAMPRMTSTGLNGKYQITHIEPGEYRIQVSERLVDTSLTDMARSFAEGRNTKRSKVTIKAGETVTHNIDVADKTIEGPAGRLTGTVELNGRPGANLRVNTWTGGRRSVTTDGNGYFDMGEIKVGKAWVTISLPAPEGGFQPTNLGSKQIEIKEGETVEAHFSFRTGTVRGRAVNDATGQPVPYVNISASITAGKDEGRTQSWTRATADKNGEFVFDPAPAGKWSLRIRQSGFAAKPMDFEVGELEDKIGVEVRLMEAVKISGKIILGDEIGEVRWMWMSFRDEKGGRQVDGARVDQDKMTFRSERMIPGNYKARLHTWTEEGGQQEWDEVPFEVPPGGTKDLVLTFHRKAPEPKESGNE